MAETIKALTELLRTIQEMAGGRIKGQIAFWIVLVIIVALAAKPGYDSVSGALVEIGLVRGLPQLFAALLLAIISTVLMIGVSGSIGTLLGLAFAITFASKARFKLDKAMLDLIRIAKTINDTNPTDRTQQSLTDITNLYNDWNKSRINRIVKWGIRKTQPVGEKTNNAAKKANT